MVTRCRGSESCPFGFVFVVCKVMCLTSGSTGKGSLADVALGVRAFSCAVVGAAIGAGVCILGGWRWCRCGRCRGADVLWIIVAVVSGALAVVVALGRWWVHRSMSRVWFGRRGFRMGFDPSGCVREFER